MSGVVVIGFDAMDPGIATRLVRDGRMPVLAGFLERSARCPTRNPQGLFVGGLWPSFATANWPGRHGFYCFRQFRSGSYTIRRCNPYDVHGKPFWQTLSEHGRRCCVIDAPLTRPADSIDGVHVVDWGTHDRMLSPMVRPPSERDGTIGRHGGHPVVGRCDHYAQRGDLEALRDALIAGASTKTELSLELLQREHWDLFLTVYGESHCAGHQFWSLHDPAWPGHDASLRAGMGDPLEQTYEALDGELARLLGAVRDDATVIVLLSHGMGPHHDGDHLLAEVARRLDVASGPAPRVRQLTEVAHRRWERANRSIARRRRPDDRTLDGATSVDGSRRLFPVPNNGLYGGVRVNLQGREPRGRVAQQDFDDLLNWISDRFLELVDADDGGSVVRRVLRTDDLFSGEQRDQLPDLLVDWRRDRPITSAASSTVGVVGGRYSGIRSGDHRPAGLLAVRAPGVAPGPRVGAVDIIDIAPTIATWLGVSLHGVEGRAVADLLPRTRSG